VVLEIEDHTNTQLGYPQIVQHQSTFVVGDFVDHFRVHDDGIERNEIGNEQPYLLSFIEDVEGRLLPKRNFLRPNSTTKAFSYGFSISPWPSALSTSMAQPTIWNTSSRKSNLPSLESTGQI
jgi:hypothetical protein